MTPNFRHRRNNPAPIWHHPFPSGSMVFFSYQPLREGFYDLSSFGRAQHVQFFPLLPMDRHFAIQREMERQIIREEIIEAEILRRGRLVEEVRRELMLERHVGLHGELESIHPSSTLSNGRSPDFQPENIPLEERLEGSESMPFQRSSKPLILEVKPGSVVSEETPITMGKPILDLSGLKRKADTPLEIVSTDGPQTIPASSKKTRSSKSVWSCSLCQVSAWSEAGLKEHLNGRKHKFKELKLKQYNKQNKQDPLKEGEVETLIEIKTDCLTSAVDKKVGNKQDLLEEGKVETLLEIKTDCLTSAVEKNVGNKQDLLEEGEVETLIEIKTDCLTSAVEKKVGNKQDPLEEGEVETLLKIKTDCLPKKEEDSALEKKVGNKQDPLVEGEVETLLEIKTDCLPKKEEEDSAVEKKVGNNEVGEMKVEMEEKENDNELKTTKTEKANQLKHWCEICKFGTPVLKLMRAHKMGEKHWENVKLFGGRVIPTVIRTNSYK